MALTTFRPMPEGILRNIPPHIQREVHRWLRSVQDVVEAKIEVVGAATADNVATFDSDGMVQDSGKAITTGDLVGTTDIQTLTNKTLTTPTIASFVNATHNHEAAAGGGTLDEDALALTDVVTNDVSITKHGFTPKAPNDSTQYLDGTGTWSDPDHGDLGGLADDDHTQYVLANGTRDIDYAAGDFQIGNVTGGNYTQFEADGTIEFVGAATVWEDLRVPGLAARVGGTAPGFDPFLGAGGLYAYTFDGTGARVEEVHFMIQLPHSYKEGSDIYPHVHWTPTTAAAGNVVWQLEYSWASIDGTFGATTTIASTAKATGATAWAHRMSVFSAIDGDPGAVNYTISSMLVCRLFRDGNHADDSYAADVSLLEFDIHFESDTVGSRTTSAK